MCGTVVLDGYCNGLSCSWLLLYKVSTDWPNEISLHLYCYGNGGGWQVWPPGILKGWLNAGSEVEGGNLPSSVRSWEIPWEWAVFEGGEKWDAEWKVFVEMATVWDWRVWAQAQSSCTSLKSAKPYMKENLLGSSIPCFSPSRPENVNWAQCTCKQLLQEKRHQGSNSIHCRSPLLTAWHNIKAPILLHVVNLH